jgi:acetyltransferase-like isoleucine patch superfamily enzyme
MLAKQIIAAWRLWRLRAAGVEIDSPLYILGSTCIRHVFSRGQRGRIHLGPRAMISHGVVIESWGGDVHAGRDVFFGPHTVIYGHGGVEIGDMTLIAMHCRIVSSNHMVPPMDRVIQYEPDVLLPVRIGRDVWLGAGVTVLGGVTIGDGCVVGAGAVVTKDLPAGSLARGTPAEIKGWRDGANPTGG